MWVRVIVWKRERERDRQTDRDITLKKVKYFNAECNNNNNNDNIKAKIDKTRQNTKWRLYGDGDEKVHHILSEWNKLAQREDKTKHDWVGKVIHREVCKKLKFDNTHMVHAQTRIHLGEWDAQNSVWIWDTKGFTLSRLEDQTKWQLTNMNKQINNKKRTWLCRPSWAPSCYGDIFYHTPKMDSSNLNIFSELSLLGENNFSFLTRHLTDRLQAENG